MYLIINKLANIIKNSAINICMVLIKALLLTHQITIKTQKL